MYIKVSPHLDCYSVGAAGISIEDYAVGSKNCAHAGTVAGLGKKGGNIFPFSSAFFRFSVSLRKIRLAYETNPLRALG